jgi:photoactive yellow protein
MRFDDVDVYDTLMATPDEALDEVDFGVIGLDHHHRVVLYNSTESSLSGLTRDRVLGRHFFSEVAPCTNNFMVASRFEAEELLDATIEYVFTLRMTPTPVQLRLLSRPDASRRYLLVRRS